MRQGALASPIEKSIQSIAQLKGSVERHWLLLSLACLALCIGLLYLPALNAYFISDDFSQVRFLSVNAKALLNGQMWTEWFIGVLDGYVYFRPAAYLITFIDFLTWNQYAPGYHLTRVILHILTTFIVTLIGWQLSRSRMTGLVAGLLFAVLPVHAGAVAWIAATTDVVCGLAFMLGLYFFALCRRHGRSWQYVAAFAAFIVALSAKEVGIVFPLGILAFDFVFHFSRKWRPIEWLARHVPFWAVLVLYLLYRFFFLGSFGYRGTQIQPENIWGWLNGTLENAAAPFIANVEPGSWLPLLLLLPVILLARRERRVIAFGLIWIPLTFLPTINSLTGASDRSFYVPSLGVVLVLASIVTWLASKPPRAVRVATLGGLLVLVAIYSQALYAKNEVYHRAGEVAEAIPAQVKVLHPVLPQDARLVFTGVPDRMPDGTLVYLTGFYPAMALAYPSNPIQTAKFDRFPIWLDGLDRTYFFQVDHRKVTERADLVNVLKERKKCSAKPTPILNWDFSTDGRGWEPWNDIGDWTVRDGSLRMVANGQDPYLVTPLFAIPSIVVDRVEIEMSVQSTQANVTGQLYWLSSGQEDFSPGMQTSFPVKADGMFHTFSIDLYSSGGLLLDSQVTRFRLDPTDRPGQIAIRSVRVLSPCDPMQKDRCTCIE